MRRLQPLTHHRAVDLLVIVAIFFAVRWQARDIFNNVKISLAVTVLIGFMFYTSVYLATTHVMFKGAGLGARVKGLGVVTALWTLMWIPLWGMILVLSRKSQAPRSPADELLAPELATPASPLARAVKQTSLDACNKLVQCENSAAYANFKHMVDKQAKCEACIANSECPVAGADGTTTCGPARNGRCEQKCTAEAMLERYAAQGNCPNVVAYATANENAIEHVEAMCAEDKGMCVYGCDTGVRGTTCSGGWLSYEGEALAAELGSVEEGQGYPWMSECKRKHKACVEHKCASAPIKPPSRNMSNNCFCNTKYVVLPEAPCLRLENLCDRTSPQYLAANALKGARVVQSDVRNLDEFNVAEDMRRVDSQLSNALMF